mgnify:CR=1 FL=1
MDELVDELSGTTIDEEPRKVTENNFNYEYH